MLAFEVTVDGERLCLAALQDWALLNVALTGLRHGHDQEPDEGDIELNVGALTKTDATGVSYRAVWDGPGNLAIGSRVTIAIVATEEADKPKQRYRSDNQLLAFTKEEIERFDREDYARLKLKFERR